MLSQASNISASVKKPKLDINRPLADFHPTLYGDHFLKYSSEIMINDCRAEQVQALKEEVRRMLTITINNHSQKVLNLIDAIQRLGIAYHFEGEIEEALAKVFDNRQDYENSDDVHIVALYFRLLRQHGHVVSSDIFNKFKARNGYFKEDLKSDVQGMLSLYEASHLLVHGEDILDEALAFTSAQLQSMTSQLSPNLADQVSRALKRPIRKAVPIHEARYYLSIFEEDEAYTVALSKLAKLNFNILQEMYQKELCFITKWWKDLDLPRILPYARDRVVECYFWPLGLFFEPQFAFGRRVIGMLLAIASVLDDTYDAYGTLEELELFTSVVDRMDIGLKDELPDYLQVVYQTIIDFIDGVEEEAAKGGRSYCVYYAKEGLKRLVRAYLAEARWCYKGYVPTLEEHLSVTLTTTTYPWLISISFYGMGNLATNEVLEWEFNESNKIVNATSLICRLMDDIVSHRFEQERGHVASAVECYMKQYGVSEQKACEELNKKVANAWKDINEELLINPTSIPMSLLNIILNFARVTDVVYKDEDGYTRSKLVLKGIMDSLVINPVGI